MPTCEFTKGFRVLVDAALEEIKKTSEQQQAGKPEDDDTSTTGKTKVKVQVD